ncbi:MAG: ankyrin repeat domain-containing protein, partial [Pyrinomonadaceae bacterium]
MQIIQYIFNFFLAALCGGFLFLTAANAQTAVNYRFLEVVNTEGKPVAGATIETSGGCQDVLRTDQNGQLEKGLPVCGGDSNTTGFRVSKSDYFSYEDIGFISGFFSDRSGQPIRLELLMMPKTDAERKAVGDEQRKREFFMAAKNGDSVAVRKLLQAGLSANLTTTDLRGVPISKDVPIIMFAAASGNGETVKTLLAAGANVSNKDKPEYNALMYYLEPSFYSHYRPKTEAEKAEVIGIYEDGLRKLIEAGADVKARDKDSGQTTLMLAALSKTIGTIK